MNRKLVFEPDKIMERVIKLRKQAGLSQKELADKLFIAQPVLSHYETGINSPNLPFLISVLNFFNVSLDWVVFGDNEE